MPGGSSASPPDVTIRVSMISPTPRRCWITVDPADDQVVAHARQAKVVSELRSGLARRGARRENLDHDHRRRHDHGALGQRLAAPNDRLGLVGRVVLAWQARGVDPIPQHQPERSLAPGMRGPLRRDCDHLAGHKFMARPSDRAIARLRNWSTVIRRAGWSSALATGFDLQLRHMARSTASVATPPGVASIAGARSA
jgi:hypothetical protein